MLKKEPFDAIVIGAGPAGIPLAIGLAKAGRRTALLECGCHGGTCANVGCTPSKALSVSARIAHVGRHAREYGIQERDIVVDLPVVIERKHALVERFRTNAAQALAALDGLDVIQGRARFAGRDVIELKDEAGQLRLLRADEIFIATGARPTVPDIPGLADVPAFDSTSLMDAVELPAHLLVVGAGYVGVELAQAYRRFGTEVTLVERARQILPREDFDVATELADLLTREGVGVVTDADVLRAEPTETGGVALVAHVDGDERTLVGSHVLVAAGRVPNTRDLDVHTAGIQTDESGYILVNDRLETSVPGIYALGDVRNGPPFTHIARSDARIVLDNLVGHGGASVGERITAYTIFTDPQLGRVGLTERDAIRQGRRIRVVKIPAGRAARAVGLGEPSGLLKAIVDRETDQILGAAILCVDGGEVASVIQAAMLGGLSYAALRDAPFAHPTLAEALNELFACVDTSAEVGADCFTSAP